MNDETTSGAATQDSPPRAIQPVTRGGVATGQLRNSNGRFGGRMPRTLAEQRQADVRVVGPADEALSQGQRIDEIYKGPDAAEGYREMAREHDRAARAVTIFCLVVAGFLVIYLLWQFFGRD